MPVAPPSDLATTAELVASLLAEQAPALAELPITPVSSGWDNDVYRLGDTLAVRLPRREQAVPLVANEVRWLPLIGQLVTIPTPQPVFAGSPSDAFDRPWSVVEFLPGEAVSGVGVAERTVFARQLADFLWSLHVPAPASAPINPVRGGSLATPAAAERFAERFALLDAAGHPDLAAALRPRLDAWLAAPDHDGVDVWLHGDLHPHNLLRGSDGMLSGVIDWGDMTAGDPACDLATAWLTFDEAGRAAFRDQVDQGGPVPEATWTRAKAWALHLGLILATLADDQPWLTGVGLHALTQLASEPA